MLTANEMLALLLRNQDRRYWSHLRNGGTIKSFYASKLETIASRMIQEARYAYQNGLPIQPSY